MLGGVALLSNDRYGDNIHGSDMTDKEQDAHKARRIDMPFLVVLTNQVI